MNPALPKTRIFTVKGRGKNFEEMQKQFSQAKIRFGIAMKGRAG